MTIQNTSQGPPAEKSGRGSPLNRPPCSPDDGDQFCRCCCSVKRQISMLLRNNEEAVSVWFLCLVYLIMSRYLSDRVSVTAG